MYFRGFTKFGIKVFWRLQFLEYLRTLRLKFQKARTKIEVVLSLPCWLSQFSFWNVEHKVLKYLWNFTRHSDLKFGETPKLLTWCVPGTAKGSRNCVEKKSLWGSTVCSKFWLQSGSLSLVCKTLAAGFCNWEFRVNFRDLTVLKVCFKVVAVAITPSILMAICWELDTPIGSLPDLGCGVTANLRLVCWKI